MKPHDVPDMKEYLRAVRTAKLRKQMRRKATVRITLGLVIIWLAFVGFVSIINKIIN
jgi:hypothetical protein